MTDLIDALQEIVDELHNVDGLRSVPDAPPESNDRFPFAMVYAESGEYVKEGHGWSLQLVNVEIQAHVARTDLARDYLELMTIVDKIPRQLESGLQNERFSAVETWDGPIGFTFGNSSWGGIKTLAITYTLRVKIQDTVT